MADPSRTETATPRRRQEARKRGQIARSSELTAALVLLAVLLFFRWAGGGLLDYMKTEAGAYWGNMAPAEFSTGAVAAAGVAIMLRVVLALAPLLAVLLAVAIGINIAQFGVVFTTETLAFRPEYLNPVQGFQRIFSQRTAAELAKGFAKVGLIGWVVYAAIKSSLVEMVQLSAMPAGAAFSAAADLTWRVGIRVVLVLLALAIIDYVYQRYEYERSIRMTRQEVKDEYRQMEGDPLVKARIRQLQREASRRRMISEVPRADVVITNPVHLAVALRYDPGSGRAPVICAKGARLIAERIKEIARAHRVPVYEDPVLAQALFPVPVGAELPPALYHTVAQVLAFVYHAGKKEKERRVMEDAVGRRMREAAGAAL
jgi:flagellar biosynthetic protein FlhB